MIGGLTGALALLAGAHMLLRPRAYVGTGIPPATDPRTVRWFGAFFLVLGAAMIGLALIPFAQE